MTAAAFDATAAARRDYRLGFAMTLAGALLITPDSLIVRMIGTDAWTMVFWRGALIPTTFLLFLALRFGPSMIADNLRAGGWNGLGVALCYGSLNIAFMIALHHTSVANTLVILAASPFFAALLSRILLRESVPLPTWAAIAAGFVGIAVVMSEGLTNDTAAASLEGDLAALASALLLAASFVLIRRQQHVNMVPATAFGGYLAAAAAFPFAAPLALSGEQTVLMLGLCVILLPICFGLIALGPRRLPAPEVSLLMLLETVIGPVWVWAVLGETPGRLAFIGGAIVLTSLALHAVWRMRRR